MTARPALVVLGVLGSLALGPGDARAQVERDAPAKAVAGQVEGAPPEAERSAPGCAKVEILSTPPTSSRTGFSARVILDLNLRITLRGTATPEALQVDYFTPNGHLYQRVDVPVAAEAAQEQVRTLHGYRFPVKVSRVRAAKAADGSRARQVDAPPLPVAGTNIVANSLYGQWKVTVRPSGSSTVCQAKFTLVP
jgi:hypothetical protein